MFDLPIRKWKTLLYILLSRGSAADKIFVLWTSVVSFLGWTINLMSIYPRTCMLSVLINSITWGKSSYLNDVIRVPRPGTLMMSFLLLAPCQLWSQNKTQPWSGLVSTNWPGPSSSRCHGSVTIEVWPLWLGARNGAFNLAECCPAHLNSISTGLCCHRQRLSGGPHQRLYCKKVGGVLDCVRHRRVVTKEFRKQTLTTHSWDVC